MGRGLSPLQQEILKLTFKQTVVGASPALRNVEYCQHIYHHSDPTARGAVSHALHRLTDRDLVKRTGSGYRLSTWGMIEAKHLVNR